MDKIFSRTRSTRDIMVSAGLVIAGIAIVAVPSAVSVNILGAFLCFVGLVTFFMLKSARVDIYYNLKVNKVYVHCLKYIPYEYCSYSDWYELDADKCGNMLLD